VPDNERGKKNHNFYGSKKPSPLEFYSKAHKSDQNQEKERKS
jgi:hypothetical protein